MSVYSTFTKNFFSKFNTAGGATATGINAVINGTNVFIGNTDIGKMVQAGRMIEGATVSTAVDQGSPESIVGNATQVAIGVAALAFLPEEFPVALGAGLVAGVSLLGATIAPNTGAAARFEDNACEQ